jgi:glycerate 2-kinase
VAAPASLPTLATRLEGYAAAVPTRLVDIAPSIVASEPDRLRELLSLVDAALDAVDPEEAVRRLLVDEPPPGERITVLALGKAAPAMSRGAARALGRRIGQFVVVSDHTEEVPDGAELMVGSHPVPTSASVDAGRRILAAASEPADHVLFLVSGGGSALAEVPREGLELSDLAAVYDLMLRGGVPIEETNCVRAHLSALKGGRLAAAASAPTTTLVVSDVGKRIELVASGPTVPCRSTPAEARAVLERHGLIGRLPTAVRRVLDGPADPPDIPPGRVVVAGDGALAAEALAADAARRGIPARVVTTELRGEASTAAVAALSAAPSGAVGIFAGETTVTVRGDGSGGRNQEAALAAALEVEGTGTRFLTFGTDGIDGPTDAAGGYIDGGTAARIRDGGIDPAIALAANDSHTALGAAHALVRCGPTGVNVADLWLVDRR